MTSVTMTTPPPIGVGSTFNATMVARGKPVSMTLESLTSNDQRASGRSPRPLE
jgi:hypothetical protein